MTWTEQARVLRTIPGLEHAEFLRFGSVHRNTFVDAPRVLDGRMQLRSRPGVFLAGQITGVEGYVESCAAGFVCAVMLAQSLAGEAVAPPPPTTALGGVLTHLGRQAGAYQPSNVTWAWLPPTGGADRRLRKRERYAAMAQRALDDLARWIRIDHRSCHRPPLLVASKRRHDPSSHRHPPRHDRLRRRMRRRAAPARGTAAHAGAELRARCVRPPEAPAPSDSRRAGPRRVVGRRRRAAAPANAARPGRLGPLVARAEACLDEGGRHAEDEAGLLGLRRDEVRGREVLAVSRVGCKGRQLQDAQPGACPSFRPRPRASSRTRPSTRRCSSSWPSRSSRAWPRCWASSRST